MNRFRWSAALWAGLLLAGPAAWADEEAPLELTLTSLDGHPVELAKLRGKVLVLDVWATWCVPCKRALPHLDALAKDLAGRGLVVLAVSQDDPSDPVKPFLEKLGITHLQVALDPKHVVPERLKPEAMPTTYLLDPRGVVRESFSGYHGGDEKKLRAAVEKLLGPPAADAAPAP